MKKFSLINVITTFFIIIWINGCGGKSSENIKSKSETFHLVSVEYAKKDTISQILKVTGEVAATSIARLSSATEGPVISCSVREGDFVKKGDLLVLIGKEKAAFASLASAEVELKKEKEEYQRVEQLTKIGAIPEEELDKSRSNLARAEAQHAQALEKTKDYRIQSPWDGVVSKVLITEGDYILVRSLLIELYDPQSLVIRFNVPEVSASYVKKGIKVPITLDAYPGKTFNSVITRVYPELDQDTRTRTLEAKISNDSTLIPGMFARISIPVKVEMDATILSDNAILSTPRGDKVVFVVEKDRASLRIVKTGIEQGHNIQILEGVNPSELVVVSGNENLSDGMNVRLSKKKIPPKYDQPLGGDKHKQ